MSSGLTVVVMGVCGCGKSSVALGIAKQFDAHFKDADELHSVANIERMSAGLPLRDSDRMPWLTLVAEYTQAKTANERLCVIACSALKKQYREIINRAGRVLYVYLEGDPQLILSRMQNREDHFMPDKLLQSQLSTLEVPDSRLEQVVTVGIEASVDDVVQCAVAQIRDHALYKGFENIS